MASLGRLQMPGLVVALGGSPQATPGALPRRVLLQFRVIANAARSRGRSTRALHAVAGRKLLALSAIAQTPGMGVNDLAKALGVRQPTASQVVKALAGLQLVDVERDRRDRRGVRIRASVAGLAVLQELPVPFDYGDPLPQALGRLDGSSLRSLEAGLTDLVGVLQRSEPARATGTDAEPPVANPERDATT